MQVAVPNTTNNPTVVSKRARLVVVRLISKEEVEVDLRRAPFMKRWRRGRPLSYPKRPASAAVGGDGGTRSTKARTGKR